MPSNKARALTREQVERARALYRGRKLGKIGLTLTELSKVLGVSTATIFNAVNEIGAYEAATEKEFLNEEDR